ncbi:MAG: hypothetical protein M5U01_38930 [Ardenticatenaceae bacterium]|nr:hypothetical protein [Ardenticatenaceae bacterium]
MDRRSLRSLWLVASLGLALVLVIGSAWPSVAAPPLQQGPTLTFQTPNLPNDLPASQRGAFALMSDAERTVANALLAVEADPLFATTATVTGTNLLPSTNTVLGVTHNMLGTIGDGLDDFNLIASREAVPPRTVAPAPGLATTPTVTGGAFTTATPALTTTPTVTGGAFMTATPALTTTPTVTGGAFTTTTPALTTTPTVTGGALTTTTPALTTTPTVTGGALTTTTPALAVTPTLPGPGSIFTPTTAQPQFGVAGGACGDLVNLVRAARRDVARIQGRAGFFGGLFTNVDPAERRAALDSLRSDHQQMQQALQCLAQSQPVPVTGQRTPRAIGTQAPLTTTISLTPTVVGSPAATITTTAPVTETGPVAPARPSRPPTTTTTPLTETGAVSPARAARPLP